MSIKNINIKNFTVFEDIDIKFNSGVNVIIGENGTGKTHLMKAIYSMITKSKDNLKTFTNYFQTNMDMGFARNREENIELSVYTHDCKNMMELVPFMCMKVVTIMDAQGNPDFKIDGTAGQSFTVSYPEKEINTVYIPAKDILTHSEGFISLYEERDIAFDKTFKDIIIKSQMPKLKSIPELGEKILPQIEEIIGGKVVEENQVFYIAKNDGTKVQFSLEAEGIKKIAIIWSLIMNGSISKDTVLFWDEPEANINPKLLRNVAEILLELSKQGVQVFMATHNYVLAKYMDILSEDEGTVEFHSLYKTDKGVQCESDSRFAYLEHNAIRDEYINLYETEVLKEF